MDSGNNSQAPGARDLIAPMLTKNNRDSIMSVDPYLTVSPMKKEYCFQNERKQEEDNNSMEEEASEHEDFEVDNQNFADLLREGKEADTAAGATEDAGAGFFALRHSMAAQFSGSFVT